MLSLSARCDSFVSTRRVGVDVSVSVSDMHHSVSVSVSVSDMHNSVSVSCLTKSIRLPSVSVV